MAKTARTAKFRPGLAADAPPYGAQPARTISRIHGLLVDCLPAIAEKAVKALSADPALRDPFARLNAEELEKATGREVAHLAQILAPDLDEATHRLRAKRIGRGHEIACIDLTIISRFYELIYRDLVKAISRSGLAPRASEAIVACLAQRLMIDVSSQAASHYEYQSEVSRLCIAIDKAIDESANLADLLRGLMRAVTSLDGIVAALFSRPDSQGVMQIEAYGGEKGREYADALLNGLAPMFSVDANCEAGRGPAGRAWRSRQFQVCHSTRQDASIAAWRKLRESFRIRSSAAVPLIDEAGEPFALLSLYSYAPGFFSGRDRQTLLRHVQQVTSHAVRASEHSKVIPVSVRRRYFDLIDNGAVEMFYQPIVDLRNGRLDYVEALARMRDSDGKIVAPADFLPALGDAGLLRLFRVGLEQVCRDLKIWRSRFGAPKIKAAMNLPAEGLVNDAYRDSLFEAFERWNINPGALQIEVLESRDPIDVAKRDARILELQAAGVKVVQDDLGSGHSSLLRLERIPFDGVKIDQALIRRERERPWRALEFIYHLTSLSHDVDVPVTVEGLECPGMIEAAAMLGADYGQGYGVARPMPAGEVHSWLQRWSIQIDRAAPRTVMGLLACFMLWERQFPVNRPQSKTSKPPIAPPRFRTDCVVSDQLDQSVLRAYLADAHAAASIGVSVPERGSPGARIIGYLKEICSREAI